jgi:hypothetical protein
MRTTAINAFPAVTLDERCAVHDCELPQSCEAAGCANVCAPSGAATASPSAMIRPNCKSPGFIRFVIPPPYDEYLGKEVTNFKRIFPRKTLKMQRELCGRGIPVRDRNG